MYLHLHRQIFSISLSFGLDVSVEPSGLLRRVVFSLYTNHFSIEDEDSMLLRNVGTLSKDYNAQQPRRPISILVYNCIVH
jgi:hypothetical protein